MNADRPLCLLLGALGGQGGGLLMEWLTGAAQIAGFPAQATSIPGVAQRTGATTYYFELYPQQQPPGEVIFSLFPSSGDIDLLATLEPTEAGRAIENGWVTRRTRVITTTRRIYSTAEKSIAGDGRIDPLPLLQALAAVAGDLQLLDPDASPLPLNARLLGCIAASGVLPLNEQVMRESIRQCDIAVERNLAGFDDGFSRDSAEPSDDAPAPYQPAPPGFAEALAPFPQPLQPLLGHALARLIDYQDRDYAQRYLDRLQPLLQAEGNDTGNPVLEEAARQLATWMSYQDIIRVAQLKTRPQRLSRIRRELGAETHEPVAVRDYFKPRLAELMALFPGSFAAKAAPTSSSIGAALAANEPPISMPVEGALTAQTGGLALRWPTSSPLGYGALKLLASLRRLRRHGRGYRREQAVIEHWLTAVIDTLPRDRELARLIARLAVWVRGYGVVRERGLAQLERLLGDLQQRLEQDPGALAAELNESLNSARTDPEEARCG